MHIDPVRQASSTLQSHHQLTSIGPTHPPATCSPPNAPLPQQQILPLSPQLPNQFSQNQIPLGPRPQCESYFPSSGQTPETPNLHYQLPPQQQLQPQPPSPPQQQFQPNPLPQYSHPLPPTRPHASLSAVNAPQSQPRLPPLGQHSEETPYIPSQNLPVSMHQPGQPPYHPSSGASPSHKFYRTPSHMYESSSSRPGPGFSPAYGSSSVPSEPYPYGGSPSQYGCGSLQQPSSPSVGQSGGSACPQFPTARILPDGLRPASGVGGGSSSAGSGNKAPIDDVVDKLTNMGFPRDHVRAPVRRLTDNGQSVDLNVVLDKLMNDVEVQPPRGLA